jgi:hypothetical protein
MSVPFHLSKGSSDAGRAYQITVKGDWKCKLDQIRKMAQMSKMFFRGDEHKGSFNGGPYVLGFHIAFKGSYLLEGDQLTITILEKPALVSWEQIGDIIKEYFAD